MHLNFLFGIYLSSVSGRTSSIPGELGGRVAIAIHFCLAPANKKSILADGLTKNMWRLTDTADVIAMCSGYRSVPDNRSDVV